MPTEFQEIYDIFLSKITDFDYTQLTQEELNEELLMMLKKGLAKFVTLKSYTIDYFMESFNRKLTILEMDIISSFMLSEYLNSKIYSISLLRQNLSSKDFAMYSQANHLKQLMDLKTETDKYAHYWMGRYNLLDFTKDGGN